MICIYGTLVQLSCTYGLYYIDAYLRIIIIFNTMAHNTILIVQGLLPTEEEEQELMELTGPLLNAINESLDVFVVLEDQPMGITINMCAFFWLP